MRNALFLGVRERNAAEKGTEYGINMATLLLTFIRSGISVRYHVLFYTYTF